MTVPNKVAQRLVKGVKRFQPIISSAKARDASEADTVTIITDMMAELFGFDKYSELTAEMAIRGTYCDLATKVDGKVQSLVEVKAIGGDLKDAHVKQAVDYAANQGVEWVILTNGHIWRIYKVGFAKPITQTLVVEVDVLSADTAKDQTIETLYLFCREGCEKTALEEYHARMETLSSHFMAAVLLSEPVVDMIRRELRRVSPDVKTDEEQVRDILTTDVIRRDALEGERADDARKRVARAARNTLRRVEKKDPSAAPVSVAPPT